MFLEALPTLFLLLGLELVLGIDNILMISILVEKLPETSRPRARKLGLILAMVARIVLLFLVLALARLTDPILFDRFSIRDLVLLSGGLFLLWKAVVEIHHTVELRDVTDPRAQASGKLRREFTSVITQIVLIDLVFSLDSVITAVGLTDLVWVIIVAVILSFAALISFAEPIGRFILKNPSIKILALSFLVTIGITIFLEGLHHEIPKAYIYLPMGFALGVEMLQLRYYSNRKASS